MLIKTQVKRRAQGINQYIGLLKSKINSHRYKQAIEFLRSSRDSINNSYMAPYNPNAYLLDSLKTKNEKLRKQKQAIQLQILQRAEQINKIKMKRGFTKENLFFKSETDLDSQFFIKMKTDQVQAYVSRLSLKLQDVHRIDYQGVILQTDYRVLKIIINSYSSVIPFKAITHIESDDIFILINWRDEKENIVYMILKYEQQQERKLWSRCFTFSKLICDSESKTKLFFKQNQTNLVHSRQEQNKNSFQVFKQPLQNNSTNLVNKYLNLNISTNKTAAFDRLRRKSQYYTGVSQNNHSAMNWSKLRKISEDLTIKQSFFKNNNFQQKRLNQQRSQKSFEDEQVPSVSGKSKKQDIKKQSDFEFKISKQQRQKSQSQLKNKSQNSQSNRQIFFNQSSIHWIQQQNEQTKSKQSFNKKPSKKNIFASQFVNNQENVNDEATQHISEVPPQGQQSPLLPYNLRQKKRQANLIDNKLQVRIKKISKTSQGKNTVKSGSNASSKNKSLAKSISNRSKKDMVIEGESFLEERQSEDKNEQSIDSINQQQEDQESGSKSKKINKSNLSIQDKSQDIISQNQNSQTQSRKYGLDDLKYGIFLLKCSPNSWNPHKKKLHLSNNDEQLCYKNQRGDDLKKINLSDIQKIQYNKITPGITKHIKNIEKRRCLAIKYKLKNQYKMLQFYLLEQSNIQDLQNFYQKLDAYVKYKNSHLD